MNRLFKQVERVCLHMKGFKGFLLRKPLIACVLGFVFSGQATPVEIYSAPAAVAGDGSTQIETLGIFKYAYCGYNSGGAGNLTITGKEGKTVTFVTSTLGHLGTTTGLGTDIGFSPNAARAQRDGSYEPVTGLTGNYRLALRDLYFVNTTPFTCVATLKNLVAGRTYLVQIFASDGYGTTDRQVNYTLSDGTDSNAFQIDLNDVNANKGKGQVACFKAVAESTTLVLTMNAAVGNFAGFSAIQVRDITPMYWTVASGNWDTTGTNWDPATDSEIIWNAATGSVVNAYFTNNATAILTSDVWARDVNVYSNTTIKRPATSATTTLTTMGNLTINADRTLTVGSGTGDQRTAIVVSNAVTGAGVVSIKNDSRIVLGKNVVGSVNAFIVGDGGDYRGAIQSIDHGNAEWSGQITTTYIDAGTRLGAGYNSVLTISGKVSGDRLTIRSEADVQPVGVVMLSNPSNDYTGDTTIYTPLRLGCTNAIPLNSKWAFASAVSNPSVDLNGFNQEVRDFVGSVASAYVNNSASVASVLTVNNATSITASGLRMIGNFALVKKGAGTLTLAATNTYSGTTTIEAGTLALSASGEISGTEKVILAGGTFDLSGKTDYTFTRPLQVITNSAVVGLLTMGADTELLFDGASVPLAGGTITMAGQTLKLTTTATLAAGSDYPLISGYEDEFPSLDSTGLTIPDGATASLVLAGGTLSLSVVAATTDTTTTLATEPAETGVYGTNIVITATISPAEVPDGTTVNLYAASDLDTVFDSGVVSGGQVQFTVVKPTAGAYSYVAKYMGGGIYRPSQSAASSSVTIQPKTLAISDIQLNKLFDGTTNVAPSFVTTGVVPGEPNPVTCAAYYEDAAPGTLKPVALVWNMVNPNYALTGNDAAGEGTIFENTVWTGGAADGSWDTPLNWDHSIVPNNSGVTALFNTDTTVALASAVSIKKLIFNADVTLNGPGTFTVAAQYSTGEVAVASSKTAIFNALINSAWEGIPKTGLGTLVLVGDHRFGGKLDVREGVAEINQTVAGALMYRNYSTAENATLRFVCAGIGSAGTQLTGTHWVTGDGTFEVVSGYLRIQSDVNKVNMAMSEKGQILVRSGAKMDNSNAGGNRYANNKARLLVEGTGLFGLNDDTVRVGSLHGDGQVKADYVSHTLTITGDSDGSFSGVLTQKDASNKLTLLKSGPGTQIFSGTNTYTGTTTLTGGRLTLEGGDNRLSVSTQVIVTNAVLNLGLTHQTLNNNPDFRAESTLAVDVSKTEIGRLTLTNSVDVSSWKMTINNPSVYPKGKRFAVVSTGTDQLITGAPTLVDMPSGFIIYNQDNTIYVDSPAMILFFK